MSTGQQKYYDNLERYLSLCKSLAIKPDEDNMYSHQSSIMKTYGYKFAYDGYDEIDFFKLFTDRMLSELKNNDHKGNWKEFAVIENRNDIFNELSYHLEKLQKAIYDQDNELVKEYSADLGNISMFMFKTTL